MATPSRITLEPDSPDFDRLREELGAFGGSAREGWLLAPLTDQDRQRLQQVIGVIAVEPVTADDRRRIHPALSESMELAAPRLGDVRRPRATVATTPTIGSYDCYNTVEGTYALAESIVRQFPNLASWHDIGDSWFKASGSGGYEVYVSGVKTINIPGGYDLYVLVLTNRATSGTKPRLFLQASLHALEYSAAPTVARFAQ